MNHQITPERDDEPDPADWADERCPECERFTGGGHCATCEWQLFGVPDLGGEA